MALGATIYVFDIELADSDRGVYQPLHRVARHPSESEDFLTRILAYCLEYTEGFSNGLFEPECVGSGVACSAAHRRIAVG